MSTDKVLERLMSLHPKLIDLTLDRVWHLLAGVGDPQDSLPNVIHIAGTNGKGSTQAMIRAGLEGAGHRVNAYTSPHLARFHERIRMCGQLISEDDLMSVLEECEAANAGEPITYFEITTVAALLAFARQEADYTLLEVGLGGRLDATNVIEKPSMTVITPVSMDHEQFLGNTIEAIAAEKAGILKSGSFGVIARQDEAALEVIEQIGWDVGATLKIQGRHWHIWEEHGKLIFQDETGLIEVPMPVLRGPHQLQNAGTALACLRLIRESDEAMQAAMTQADWPARMQKLTSGPLVTKAKDAEIWLDGGHNPAAGAALRETLDELPKRPTFMIVGMMSTKDARGFLTPLADVPAQVLTVDIPGEDAALSAKSLSDLARGLGIEAAPISSVREAMDQIVSVNPAARVVVCGSLYLAGHILKNHA